MKDSIQWGILGTGFISGVMVDAIRQSKHGVLAAVAGRSTDKLSTFAHKHQISKTYLQYQDMIDDPAIDAIYIGLPNHLHHEWIIKAAKAGKHILCEKPFTISVEEAEEAIAVVKENHVFCAEAMMYRYHPFVGELKKLVEGGLIGEVKSIDASYCADIAHLANPNEGGAIRNLGCYPMSLVRYIMNDEPKYIMALDNRLNPKTNTDSESTAMLVFHHGKTATIKTVDDTEMTWKFIVHGARGDLKVISNPWLPEEKNVIEMKFHDEQKAHRITYTTKQSLYTFQIDCANDSIMKGHWANHPGVPLEESLANTKALETWRALVCPVQPVETPSKVIRAKM